MKKIMRLVSVQLWTVLSDMLSIGKNRKKAPKFLYGGFLFFVLLLGSVSFMYSLMIGSGLKMFSCTELLPPLMMAVTCVITFMTTIFKVKGTIFGFRDYDMTMSLPVSTGAIAVSRLLILYLLNFLFVVIIIIPMLAAYGIIENPSPIFYLIGIITMFFIPLVPIVVATLLGTLIAYAASKFKHSNLFNIVFSLGCLLALVSYSFTINGTGNEMVQLSKTLIDRINRLYPLSGMYMDAMVHYDIRALILFLGISAAAFVIYTVIVKSVFKKINTLMMTGSYHRAYRLGSLKTSSPFMALYMKELKRLISSTLYVINAVFGIAMLTLAAVALLFVDLDKILGSPETIDAIKMGGPIYISFCVMMTCTSMASISLEGNSLWIIKSLPIPPKTVYLSKIAVNLTVLAPAVVDVIILGIALKMGLPKTILILLITVACGVFISFYGLVINLLLPNFSWTSENVVIKNSAATMVTVFSSMAYVAIQSVFIILIPSMIASYLCYFALTVLVDIVLYVVITTYGKRRYNFL